MEEIIKIIMIALVFNSIMQFILLKRTKAEGINYFFPLIQLAGTISAFLILYFK